MVYMLNRIDTRSNPGTIPCTRYHGSRPDTDLLAFGENVAVLKPTERSPKVKFRPPKTHGIYVGPDHQRNGYFVYIREGGSRIVPSCDVTFMGLQLRPHFLPMTKFEMTEGTPSATPAMTLEHTAFPHLTTVEWQALHRLAAVSGEFVVTSLLSSATPDQQRQAIQEFIERELAKAKRRVITPSHSSRNDAMKMETPTYSGVGQDRLPLNRLFREVDIAIASRMIEAPTARVNFLLSRFSGKAKEWALGKLDVDRNAFHTLVILQSDLRLAFEPPQDESRMRAAFFALRQGKMSMRDYVQKTRHLVSCIVTNAINVASQVHVFIFRLREGMTRYCLTRAEPSTLEVAFALALREDYSVASSYARVPTSDARASTPEPTEIDAIEAESRSRPTSIARGPRFNNDNRPRDGRPLICYRCRKAVHRAAVCRALAPVLASAEAVGEADDMFPTAHPKTGRPPVLHAHFNATTTNGDSRLILICLHVAGAEHPLRALLDSGATNNFIRDDFLALLPLHVRVRNGPGDIVVKLADGKSRRALRLAVSLAYCFDGFSTNADFLVFEVNYAFKCILGMPWLARYLPEVDWLARSVRRRTGYDVSEVFTHLLVAPSRNVAVVDRTSTTPPLQRESDGPRCVKCTVSVIGHVTNPPSQAACEGIKRNAVEHRLPHVNNAVEQGLPRMENAVEQRLPYVQCAVEQGLPLEDATVELRPPFADDSIGQTTLRDTGMTETEVPCLEEDDVSASETSASSSGSRCLTKSKRNRSGRRRLRRRPTEADQAPSSESVNVVEYSEDSPNRIRTVEVANPPSDAATITRIPGLSWKHFLRDLKAGEIEQVCLLTGADQPTVLANVVSDDASSPRPKAAEPKSVRETLKKATGGWRVVHAFNKLNDATIPAQTPIHRKDMVLDTMSGSFIYSVIDLTDGFYQILMRESDIPLTAVSPPSGMVWEWLWLGLANYLHQYTKGYAGLIQPMSFLLEKGVSWDWRPEHQDAFDAVKKSLASAPVLILPDTSRPFHVVCDASDFAIGCALMQLDAKDRERVVSYQSRQMKTAEKNYPVHDKELLAMHYALIKFRVYLLGE
ncbi:unnamed protein product [Phytophthora fragariaefolia]|uniref:Unnamed protein product n=1 Tax=Phytophthora fragariaefolia TaxID=1490495 RepID=A0A9W6U9V4_9STRA|nr:unnamed protein product [Phytophthora fragariaefolia]